MACGDDSLAPHVERLAGDPDPRVRSHMAAVGMNLSPAAQARLRSALLILLAAPDREVRLTMAAYLSERGDRACGPALLQLLRDRTLDDGTARRVIDLARTLTGDAVFGVSRAADGKTWVGQDAHTPGTPAHAAAVARFAAWVEGNEAGR